MAKGQMVIQPRSPQHPRTSNPKLQTSNQYSASSIDNCHNRMHCSLANGFGTAAGFGQRKVRTPPGSALSVKLGQRGRKLR